MFILSEYYYQLLLILHYNHKMSL